MCNDIITYLEGKTVHHHSGILAIQVQNKLTHRIYFVTKLELGWTLLKYVSVTSFHCWPMNFWLMFTSDKSTYEELVIKIQYPRNGIVSWRKHCIICLLSYCLLTSVGHYIYFSHIHRTKPSQLYFLNNIQIFPLLLMSGSPQDTLRISFERLTQAHLSSHSFTDSLALLCQEIKF